MPQVIFLASKIFDQTCTQGIGRSAFLEYLKSYYYEKTITPFSLPAFIAFL